MAPASLNNKETHLYSLNFRRDSSGQGLRFWGRLHTVPSPNKAGFPIVTSNAAYLDIAQNSAGLGPRNHPKLCEAKMHWCKLLAHNRPSHKLFVRFMGINPPGRFLAQLQLTLITVSNQNPHQMQNKTTMAPA